jgi:hypothetical protein
MIEDPALDTVSLSGGSCPFQEFALGQGGRGTFCLDILSKTVYMVSMPDVKGDFKIYIYIYNI